jgi:nickel transport protein
MRLIRPLLVAAALTFASHAWAHTVWLEPVAGKSGMYRVIFGGHLGKEEKYRPEKLKSVEAVNAQGMKLEVKREVMADGIRLHISSDVALVVAHFDNGIHTRPPQGPSVEKPMSEVPGPRVRPTP